MKEMAEFDKPPIPDIDVNYAGGTISSVFEGGTRRGGHALRLSALLNIDEENPNYRIGTERVSYDGLSENETVDNQMNIVGRIFESIERGHNSVTTHGTDSMEQIIAYTSRTQVAALARQRGIRVIFTGANEDISHPQSDVADNFKFALEMAAVAGDPGVFLAYHGKLIPADEVVKLPYLAGIRPTFVSKNSAEYKKALTEQRKITKAQQDAIKSAYGSEKPENIVTYEVNQIVADHDTFLNFMIANPTIKSVLLKLYHSGTANTIGPSVAELVSQLRAGRPNLMFFAATETGEPVTLHSYETSLKLLEAGVVPLYNMLFDVAKTKLSYVKSSMKPGQRIQAALVNKAGEIDPKIVRANKADIDYLKQLYGETPPPDLRHPIAA